MELITGSKKSRLEEINRAGVANCDFVEAAIAYITDEKTLIKECVEQRKSLRLWARYDCSVPVAPDILDRFFRQNSPNFELRLVPDIFHPKVIWWHGYGAYVGSANLTHSAWFQNYEAGVFLTQLELEENGLAEPLGRFFKDVHAASHPLTEKVVEEMRKWVRDASQTAQTQAEKRFQSERVLPILPSLILIDSKSARDKRREEFLKEWEDTRQKLLGLATKVVQHVPVWLDPSIPAGAQTDRFLHSYYVEFAGATNEGVERAYRENRADPEAAVAKALEWWRSTDPAPANADTLIREWFPVVEKHLAKERLLNLTEEEFADLCAHVHALHDHSLRVSWQSYGLSKPLPTMDSWGRARFLGRWLYGKRSRAGRTTAETIYDVIYGQPLSDVPERIFAARFNSDQKIPHLGLGSLGEMAGWAHPNMFPPRNGRTSKSLRALGYNVTVHADNAGEP